MTSESNTQSLSPVYFPFTFMAPSLAEALWFCFDRAVLYRPVASTPEKGLQEWVRRGALEIRVPFEGVIDEKALRAQLQSYRTWGLMHQGADLAYLKEVGRRIAPVDPPISRIASEIKSGAEKIHEKSTDRQLALQLFLHLAQDFDHQSWELGEQLNRFQLQQQALQAFFRVDQTEEDQHFVSADADPFPGSKEDPGGFMIEHRMSAWKDLFHKDHDPPNLLFTDSPIAHAWLLEAAPEKIRVSTFNVPFSGPPASDLPWKAPVEELFHALLTTPWSEQLRQRIEGTTRQIEDMIESWKRSSTKRGNKMTAFHWYLVPDLAPHSLLNQRCGLKVDSQGASGLENSIVGLVEHGVYSRSHNEPHPK